MILNDEKSRYILSVCKGYAKRHSSFVTDFSDAELNDMASHAVVMVIESLEKYDSDKSPFEFFVKMAARAGVLNYARTKFSKKRFAFFDDVDIDVLPDRFCSPENYIFYSAMIRRAETDIDLFVNVLAESGFSLAEIKCYTGLTDHAIKKARFLGGL